MATPGEILLITFISGTIATILMYAYKVKKISRKDYRQEDDAKNRKPDITIGL